MDCGDALSMRLPGNLCKNRINHVKITLDPSDTYTVEFGRIWGTNYKVLDTISDVYVENLREVFEGRTGLATSLGTMGR
jgi:GTP:adenosylcobinamide-phosphate guanylyltransferase